MALVDLCDLGNMDMCKGGEIVLKCHLGQMPVAFVINIYIFVKASFV